MDDLKLEDQLEVWIYNVDMESYYVCPLDYFEEWYMEKYVFHDQFSKLIVFLVRSTKTTDVDF